MLFYLYSITFDMTRSLPIPHCKSMPRGLREKRN